MSDDILFEVVEKVGVITLNRPEKKCHELGDRFGFDGNVESP